MGGGGEVLGDWFLRDSLSPLVTGKRVGKIKRKACSYQRTAPSSCNITHLFFSCATVEEQRKRK